jgi:hypothetical protein
MPAPYDRFQRDSENVAAKVMDGEAVIINLANGMYYSMDNTGAVMWAMIAAGYSLDEVATALAERYDVSHERALADVDRLVGELLAESLLVPAGHGLAAHRAEEDPSAGKYPYEPPVLNAYRDMGDLLALDPPVPGFKDIPWNEPGDESSSQP